VIEMATTYDKFGTEIEDDAADVGGLSVYKDVGVVAAMAKRDALAMQQQARYDAQAKALAEKRFAPSFSERMFQLSAALAQPTTRRGFGGILENVTPVLAAQQKAQREGQISRQEAFEQLETNRLAQQMGLIDQDLSTSLALAKINQEKPSKVVGTQIVNGVPVAIMQDAKGGVTTQPLGGETVGEAASAERPKTEIRGGVEGYFDENGVWKPLPYRPKPKQTQISGTSNGQPVFMGESGPVDAFGNPVTSFDAKPRTLTAPEQKILIASEDIFNSATDTLTKLRRVIDLNPKALEGSLTGFRKQVGSLFASDDPAYVATQELDNTLKSMALTMLKSTFPGGISDGERKALMDLQGSSSLPRAARDRIYRNAFEAAQTIAARAKDRMAKTREGFYTERTLPSKPAAAGNVIRYDKTGKRI